MQSIRQAVLDAVNARVEYKVFKNTLEKNYIIEFLKAHDWNQSKTARIIGVHYNTMTYLIKKHRIKIGED
jgi:transcriptional regulator with GAF, ATPase, and Fis domain